MTIIIKHLTNDLHPDSEEPRFDIRCWFGFHRLYETVKNFGTGAPSTGFACYRCRRKWDWEGRPRPIDYTGH